MGRSYPSTTDAPEFPFRSSRGPAIRPHRQRRRGRRQLHLRIAHLFGGRCVDALRGLLHGQRDSGDDASGDFFNIQYRVDGGSWVTVVSNGDSRSVASWATATAQVPAGSVEVRVQCSDGAGPGDIVECGIDDLSICEN